MWLERRYYWKNWCGVRAAKDVYRRLLKGALLAYSSSDSDKA